MIRKIIAMLKKWASAAQGNDRLNEPEHEAHPERSQANDPAELNEDTANEVVATWNLLNPP